MSRRLMLRNASGGVEPILPDAYQRCEWVGVSRDQTQRYIYISDTTLTKADLSNYTFAFTMENIADHYNAGVNSVGIVCGTSANAGCYFASQANLLGMGFDSIGQYSSLPKRDYIMRWTASGGEVVSGGDVIAHRSFTNMSGNQRFLIGSPAGYNYASFNCYGAEIKYQGNTIAKLVPCYRKSNNVIGFYDIVGNIFRYGSLNAKGADV